MWRRAPVMAVGAYQALIVATRIGGHPAVARVKDAGHGEDVALRKAVLPTEFLELRLVACCVEGGTDAGVSHCGARDVQAGAPGELIERRLGDGEQRPRLAAIHGQRQADVQVVPPGVVAGIDVPVAALQHEHARNPVEQWQGELRIEQQIDPGPARGPGNEHLIPPELAGGGQHLRRYVFMAGERLPRLPAAQEDDVVRLRIQRKQVLEKLARIDSQPVRLIQQARHHTDRPRRRHVPCPLNGRDVASWRFRPPCPRQSRESCRGRNPAAAAASPT